MIFRATASSLLFALPLMACGVGYSQSAHNDPGANPPSPAPSASQSPAPNGPPNVSPPAQTPPVAPSADPTVVWTSDDGVVLGLGTSSDRIVVVTSSKVVSFLRNGGDVRVLATSSAPFAYGGAIAVDEGTTYFGTNGGVFAVPTDGSGPPVALGAEGYATAGIAVDATNVYWLSNDAVLSVSRAGGPATILTSVRGLTYENAFTLADGVLYWSTNGGAPGADIAELSSISVHGGTPQVILPSNVYSLVPNGAGGIAWLEEPAPTLVNADGAQSRSWLGGWVNEATRDELGNWYFRDETTGAVSVVAGTNDPQVIVPSPPVVDNRNPTPSSGMGPHLAVNRGQVIWAERDLEYPTSNERNVVHVFERAF